MPRRDPIGARPAPVLACLTAGIACVVTAVAAGPVLDVPVRAVWRGVPLDDWTGDAAAVAGVPIIRDRRVDATVPVVHEGRGEPLADVLAEVAAAAGARPVVLGSSVRLVPMVGSGDVAAGELARRMEVARLPATERRVVTRRDAWRWPAGAKPRDLIATTAAAAGVEIESLEAIPHDHLPAATLPPLELGERFDLILAHYDLRASWESVTEPTADAGVRARIVPLPMADAVGAAPRVAAGGAAGRNEDRRGRIRRGGRPMTNAAREEPRFTLRLEASLEQAVTALAARFDLEPAIRRDALAARGILPGEIVRVEVQDAGRDDLFDAITAPLGLRWRIDDRRLVIEPR